MLRKSLIILLITLLSGCMNLEIRKMGGGTHKGGAMLCYEELLSPKVTCQTMWYSPDMGPMIDPTDI